MKEEMCGGPEANEGSGRAGKAPVTEQAESKMESQDGGEEPGRGMQQRWEAQWQQFLKALQSPHSAWGIHHLSEVAPWDDAKAFLASFEQVAAACQWPRAEWVAQLLPALSGEAQQAFSLLAARDKEDYSKVKAAILRGEAQRRERQRQHFRQFCCQELGDPRQMYSQVQELCCQWLEPQRHTKEQILELLVLEQFLASLPVDTQSWIRAGGPDSGAQAVALLEDFLVSRREADTRTWQELLQEWVLHPLDVKKEPLDMAQGEISKEHAEIFRDTQQNISGEVTLPGAGIVHPTLLAPPEGQDFAEAKLTEALDIHMDQVMKQRKTSAPLHMVEQALMQSNQQTTFWKVLQEDGENVDSLEGSLSPQLDLDLQAVKKEDPFLLDPVLSPRLPGQESDVGKRTQLKVNNSQPGGNEVVETPRRGQRRMQEKVPVIDEPREENCESTRGQGTESVIGCKPSNELPGSLGATCSSSNPMDTEGEKASFSKYGRRICPKSILVCEHSRELFTEGPQLEEKIQLKSKSDKYDSSHTEEENHDCPGFGVTLHSNSLEKDQLIQVRKKPHKCPDCGKSFSRRSNLLTHQMIHTGKKPHKCTECGKSFSRRSYCLNHQKFHTEQKPHNCPECGNRFSQKSALSTHQMIHAGKKPHQCPDCERSFFWKSQLLMHQTIHTGEKPHKCPDCGKNFSRKSSLLDHQMIHTGKKPHQCPECGRSFFSRSNLRRHQSIHVVEKPHQCPACGKSFSHRSYLLRHQKIHSGEKPHKHPDCGKITSS